MVLVSFIYMVDSLSLHHFTLMQDIMLKEDHPLAFNMSFSISLGLLPITVSLKTAGCGIKSSGLPDEEARSMENSSKGFFHF